MDWTGLSFAIPALLIISFTIIVGGIVAVFSLVKVLIAKDTDAKIGSLKALQLFSLGVMIQFVTLPVMWIIPNEKRAVTLASLLVTSFLCFIMSVVVMNRTSLQVSALVRVGFLIVTFVNFLGLSLIVFSMPSM